MTLIPFQCPSCCGSVQVDDNKEYALCMYCGTKFEIVSPTNKLHVDSDKLETYLNLLQIAFESNNLNDVIKYCNLVFEIDPKNHKAWMIKAMSAGWGATLDNPKIKDIILTAKRAVEYTEQENKAITAEQIMIFVSAQILALLNLAITLRGGRFAAYIHRFFLLWEDALSNMPSLSLEAMNNEVEKCMEICNESKRAFNPNKRHIYTACICLNKRESYALRLARVVKSKYANYTSPVFLTKKGFK